MKHIPFVDLQRQYHHIHVEVDRAIKKILESGEFILGKEVEQFEEEFAHYCNMPYAVGVDSGLSALELGMRALGIGTGDEVLVPVNSFIASASAISFTGARPILIDCDEITYAIDLKKAESLITDRTKALILVHLYGQIADVEIAQKLARKYKLFLIEDACQAHGALLNGSKAGSFGDIAAFSFYPGKNLGAYGDAGIVVTRHKKVQTKIQMLRNYGQKHKYEHVYLGWNRRLDNLQAAILRVKLKKLDGWNKKRIQKARLYNRYLKDLPVAIPKVPSDRSHVFHIYALRAPKRDRLLHYLTEKGVLAGIHYPIPIHLQKAYRHLGYKKGDFPVAEHIAKELISLPLFPELTAKEIQYICQLISAFYNNA